MSEITPTRLRVYPDKSIPPLDPAELHVAETDLGALKYSDAGASLNVPQATVRPLEWSGYPNRDDELLRSTVIARAALARILVPATPGTRCEEGWINPDVIWQIKSGDFSAVSHVQWQALEAAGLPDEIRGFGMSLGASLIASMAANAEGKRFERIDFWDPIAKEGINLLTLALRFAREARDQSMYKKENPDWINIPNAPDLRDFSSFDSGNLSYPRGLRRFSIVDSLATALERGTIEKDTEIALISGERSRITPEKEMSELAQRIQDYLGMTAVRRIVLEGESHGMLDSIPRLSSLVGYLYGTGVGRVEELK